MSSRLTNLGAKIENPPSLDSKQVFCFWSDLLGFGNLFFERQWMLSETDKESVYRRLQNAHTIFLENTMAFQETSLILNDGLVKLHEYNGFSDAISFSMYLRSCIYTHNRIKKSETDKDLPGPRSILSFGESITYLTGNTHIDDYVFNYTKPEGQNVSTLAQNTGNPIVVYNPSPFQMNTAFSKSYILDSLGTKYGIEGNHIYVDQSVIDFTKSFATKNKKKIIFDENEKSICIIVVNKKKFPYWGFRLDKGIEVDYKGWKTNVYKMLSFFPSDEKYTEFEIEVE